MFRIRIVLKEKPTLAKQKMNIKHQNFTVILILPNCFEIDFNNFVCEKCFLDFVTLKASVVDILFPSRNK